MKILIIRHGDPDYEHDTLTEKGWREAAFLAERLKDVNIDSYYVSTMGRAKDTASLTLKTKHAEAKECEWLREFSPRIARPDQNVPMIVWDWLPLDWTSVDTYFDFEHWTDTDIMTSGKVKKEYDRVTKHLDELLASHGYVREQRYYKAVRPNTDTIALFCHFGLECVLLSHLLNISPMNLWHGCCAAPTSVTTLTTEERREGISYFRMSSFGDISHLVMNREPVSLSARFCECYHNEEERHD